MPSQLHEILLLLFRNRPQLAAELLRDGLRVELPPYTETRVEPADLSEVLPAQYHADHVVLLVDHGPVLGIIVEVQLRADERKRFVWPMYVASLRARLECPVCLLVLTVSDSVARWARKPVDLGAGNYFRPSAMAFADVPEVTDEAWAKADPELAVLSIMAHGHSADIVKASRIARATLSASADLDLEKATVYCDLVFDYCSEHVRKELQSMDPGNYQFKSEFARRYIDLGKIEGKAEGKEEGRIEGEARGRAALIQRLLALRFGALPDAVQSRICAAPIEVLDAIGERLLTAQSLQEALGER